MRIPPPEKRDSFPRGSVDDAPSHDEAGAKYNMLIHTSRTAENLKHRAVALSATCARTNTS